MKLLLLSFVQELMSWGLYVTKGYVPNVILQACVRNSQWQMGCAGRLEDHPQQPRGLADS